MLRYLPSKLELDVVDAMMAAIGAEDLSTEDYRAYVAQARAAIAVALEEVAVMLDELGDSPIMADTTAAAIRAMIPKNLP